MRWFCRAGLIPACILLCLITATPFAAELTGQESMIERYRLSLEVDPENPTLHYFLGVALIRCIPPGGSDPGASYSRPSG